MSDADSNTKEVFRRASLGSLEIREQVRKHLERLRDGQPIPFSWQHDGPGGYLPSTLERGAKSRAACETEERSMSPEDIRGAVESLLDRMDKAAMPSSPEAWHDFLVEALTEALPSEAMPPYRIDYVDGEVRVSVCMPAPPTELRIMVDLPDETEPG